MFNTDLSTFVSNAAELPRMTALSHEDGLRTLLLHIGAGEEIPVHQTKGAITVHCLKGEGLFSSEAERIPLKPGNLICLAPAVPHSVTAERDTLLLVTMWEPRA